MKKITGKAYHAYIEKVFEDALSQFTKTEEGDALEQKISEIEHMLQERFIGEDFHFAIRIWNIYRKSVAEKEKYLYYHGFRDAVALLKDLEIL